MNNIIPKEFTLGGVTWNVKIDNDRLNDLSLMGLCEFPKSLISLCNKDIDQNLVEQTFYHELVHAILDCIGERELSDNEKFTQNFALLLHQFIKTSVFDITDLDELTTISEASKELIHN